MDVTKSLIFLPFDGKTYSWKGFGIGVLFIYKKEHGETCSPTGRPLYLSVNTRLQGSVFSSAEQPLNGHWKSWNFSYLASLKAVHLLGTYVGKAG